jgi:Cd2+/Zn2+-exporting ATPase
VYAGTINGDGAFAFQTTKRAADTTLARIIHMVEEAHTRRAPSEQWVEKFARVYTPAMLALAVLIAVLPPLMFGGTWVYEALVILVIACPCALVISTPVSIVAGLTAAARGGVLIKGGAYLEAPTRLRVIAFDKTGTLTMGARQYRKSSPSTVILSVTCSRMPRRWKCTAGIPWPMPSWSTPLPWTSLLSRQRT